MERESFEDEEVAELLNRQFISIKVDREERPDIDHLYMTVCQAMTGHGGWPLTIIMTPEKKPFFAGTYFPKRRRLGRSGLMELLGNVAEKWRDERKEILEAGDKIVGQLSGRMISQLKGELTEASLDEAYVMYKQLFDNEYGGFGDAPKFPTPHNVMFLMRYYAATGEDEALRMAEKTLDAMARGGIFDHVGFGFARYSTDREWLVPHFEKMLYDNALLAMAYTEAYQITGKKQYRDIVDKIFTYVQRDMTDPQGGFYSAEDADSEGEEGKFYVWTPEDIVEVLGEEDGAWFCDVYGIEPGGNFEGHSIPNLLHGSLESQAARSGQTLEQFTAKADSLREQLFQHREGRIHPSKDDKILTSWNGLMIAALSKAAVAFDQPEYAERAVKAYSFLLKELRTPGGRLLARYRDGEAAYLGYIDDYAFLIWGLIELYEATFDTDTLRQAVSLTQEAIRLFWDHEEGGFYFYGEDGEQLFIRNKEVYDGAIPSGNSVMANNLLRLSRLSGDNTMAEYAERTFRSVAGAINRYPTGHSIMLMALQMAYGEPMELVIAGSRGDQAAESFIRTVRDVYLPNAVIVFHETGPEGDALRELLPHIGDKIEVNGKPAVYVCENYACQAPVTSADELKKIMAGLV